MKTKQLIAALIAFSSFGALEAATINVARGTGQPGVSVLNQAGTALSTGGYTIAVGSFSTVPTITDYASLVSAVGSFNVFGQSPSSSSGTTVGLLQLSTGITSNGGLTPELWNSQLIYLVIGNASTLAASDQFAIVRSANNTAFPANVAPASTTNFSTATGASIVSLANAGTISGNTLKLVGVPEPSVALLGALGVFGLVRRRR